MLFNFLSYIILLLIYWVESHYFQFLENRSPKNVHWIFYIPGKFGPKAVTTNMRVFIMAIIPRLRETNPHCLVSYRHDNRCQNKSLLRLGPAGHWSCVTHLTDVEDALVKNLLQSALYSSVDWTPNLQWFWKYSTFFIKKLTVYR